MENNRIRCTCCFCGSEMIWGSDFSLDEVYGEDAGEGIVSVLSCSNHECNASAEFILRTGDNADDN